MEAAIFAEDGRTLIASDDSGSVSDGRRRERDDRSARRSRSATSSADSLDLSPDGRLVAAASFGGSVFVWDAKTGVPYGSPLTADTSPVNDVAFSPDGRTLVTAHLSSAVVWNMDGEQVIGEPLGGPTDLDHRRVLQPRRQAAPRGTVRRRNDRVRHGDATTGSPDRRRFDRHRGRLSPRREAHRRRDDRREGPVLRSDAAGRPSARPLDVGDAAVWQVAFSPNGRLLAVAVGPERRGDGFYSQQRQGEVQLWDVDSRSRVGRAIVPGGGSVLSVAFNRGRDAAGDRQRLGGSTCGMWPPRPATASR